ncbi:methionine--tRNA ligase [Streptomyces roseochromogenus]|uniref:Methionine--tRNA ligase n=1 Tax=Streptomyces roseochromogenus subsp. oscitans DS 12.976 TaxID=1352936 RepID=V6K449_STRRC|nr:methionine--tRNA ligase [Streptomyces roseochromogenus]EST26980.1 methionyl-tRNA synthetase [Streptomyces roseochromogenus subsp. oscitans DS 12.976]
MTAPRHYITTTIPYVNARPHLGFALELVQADTLARHHRRRGDHVRLLSGTDDNSLKNVLAAEAEGIDVQSLVDRNAEAFAALRGPLTLSLDDFIRTSRDPRHRIGVERLWRRCAEAGDLYRKHYEGLYCVGCEQFYTEAELVDGRCAEHSTEPHLVAEENWFFRLSRHAARLHELIADGTLRIEPAARRNEVLALIASGLHDFSVSRSHTRARGWGIPVPDDPTQVVYVWWDALGNYVTSLGYGTDDPTYEQWWVTSERRTHLVGKGVVRFHAVYWPAMLLSAGLPLPTDILVHDYLTVGGRKISKSGGTTVDPVALTEAYGTDAVRWWLLREVPRVGDADFTPDRLIARADADFAGGLGNLVHRIVTMVHRYRSGAVPVLGDDRFAVTPLLDVCEKAPSQIDAALADFDFRRATGVAWGIVEAANRCIDATRPWELARAERQGNGDAAERLDAVLAALVRACRVLAEELRPFIPDAAALIADQVTSVDGSLPPAAPLFRRLQQATQHA